MSKLTRKQRAANARVGTVAADRRLNVVDEPEVRELVHYIGDTPLAVYTSPVEAFTPEELETMPLVIVNHGRSRVEVWRGPDGAWWRRGGWLRIRPRKDGAGSQFTILLCKGANRADLEWLLKVVKRTRDGLRELQWEKRGSDWTAWADDRTFTYSFASRSYADPYTHGDLSPDVTACTEHLCSARWHETWEEHEFDRAVSTRTGMSYSVRVTKPLDTDLDDRWFVDVHVDDLYGSPEQVAAFVSDLQWMQESCRRANEGGSPDLAAPRESTAPAVDWSASLTADVTAA